MSVPGQSSGETEKRDPFLGRTIADKFVVQGLLGSGAMGAVYRAHQVSLDRPIAIKLLHPELTNDGVFVARFELEAKAASRIDHPNLTRVIDHGREPDGLLYLAMELLDGRDLFQVLEEDWPLPTATIVDLLSQALAGLAAAHDAGIVHRDIKPENVMLLRRKADDGSLADLVKLCDFGIAKIVEPADASSSWRAARKLSVAGLVVGTPAFMSPEQARGEELDARSDLFSVGVILYQLLTGRLPFEASSPLGVIAKVLEAEPSPPSALADVDPALEAICAKAMRKAPDERYRDAREMRAALQAVTGDTQRSRIPPHPPSAQEQEIFLLPPATPDTPPITAAIPLREPVARSHHRGRAARIVGGLTLLALTGLGLRRALLPPPTVSVSHAVWVDAHGSPAAFVLPAPPEPAMTAAPASAAPMPADLDSARAALVASGLATGEPVLDAGVRGKTNRARPIAR